MPATQRLGLDVRQLVGGSDSDRLQWPLCVTSWARRLRMSMCVARSREPRPPMTARPHAMPSRPHVMPSRPHTRCRHVPHTSPRDTRRPPSHTRVSACRRRHGQAAHCWPRRPGSTSLRDCSLILRLLVPVATVTARMMVTRPGSPYTVTGVGPSGAGPVRSRSIPPRDGAPPTCARGGCQGAVPG
jgi:hypothetical protein